MATGSRVALFGKKEFKALESLTWALLAVVLLLASTSFVISKAQPCELKTAIDSIYIDYTPHPCKYNAIKEKSDALLLWAGMEGAWMILIILFIPRGFILLSIKKKLIVIQFGLLIICNVVQLTFLCAFLYQSTEIREAKDAEKVVDYVKLQSAMVSELQKRYSSDNISSEEKYSKAWNNFFIKYDCCAVREVQGTTNDFDNTPWCTTSGSCHATASQIPKTCCKDVTQDDYQNAPSTCHASVNPSTYKQSCISRMRELSVVNIEESEVITLYFCLYAMGIYQILEIASVFLLVSDNRMKLRNRLSDIQPTDDIASSGV